MERDIILDMAAFSFQRLFFDYCFSGYKSSPPGYGCLAPLSVVWVFLKTFSVVDGAPHLFMERYII